MDTQLGSVAPSPAGLDEDDDPDDVMTYHDARVQDCLDVDDVRCHLDDFGSAQPDYTGPVTDGDEGRNPLLEGLRVKLDSFVCDEDSARSLHFPPGLTSAERKTVHDWVVEINIAAGLKVIHSKSCHKETDEGKISYVSVYKGANPDEDEDLYNKIIEEFPVEEDWAKMIF